ncbi:MAG: pectate lyase, partial [Pseudopedobacter saltans]
MKKINHFLFFLFLSFSVSAQKKPKVKPFLPISVESGKLVYRADTVTGDRIPDYSYAGYMSSNEAIPFVDVKATVPIVKGDATSYIQAAIDYVSQLPLNKNGFRGAILLQKGQYEILGQIKIKTSGIVLRGSGINNGTILFGKGVSRDAIIRVVGIDDRSNSVQTKIQQDYVPVNANSFTVQEASKFKVGDKVNILRPSTKEWIDVLGTETFGGGISSLGWKPGDADLNFERKIVGINGNQIVLDVPIPNSFDKKYGGGIVTSFEW